MEQGDQTGNVVLPAAAREERDCWRQDRERGRVLRCARRETGLGRGLPLRGGSRLMGFGSITWSKSGHG